MFCMPLRCVALWPVQVLKADIPLNSSIAVPVKVQALLLPDMPST